MISRIFLDDSITWGYIKPILDDRINDESIKMVRVINEGCKSRLTRKVFRYLHDHGIETDRRLRLVE